MDPRIKTLMVIVLMLGATLAVAAKFTVTPSMERARASEFKFDLLDSAIWLAKRILYIGLAISYGTHGLDELKENLWEIIMMNPPLEGLSGLMDATIKLALAFYIPAIALLGFYLLFLSSSPEGRARAKGMLTKLVVGLVLVCISPLLITILLNISEALTDSVLSQAGISEDSGGGVFAAALEESIGCPWIILPECIGTLEWWHAILTLIEVEMGFYTFLFFMLIVWGSFIFPIVIRFLVVSTFIVLFPLAIFLYSFEFSRALGRMILEQTLVWIFLQMINALIVLTIVLSISSLPSGFMNITMLPSIIPITGCLMFSIAPLFIIRFFRGFLP